MRLDYFLYMNEAEGTSFVDTRTARINRLIKDFRNLKAKGYDINDADLQEELINKYNLNPLSAREMNYIVSAVRQEVPA